MVWKWDLALNTMQNLLVKGHWCKPVAGSEKIAIEACKIQSTERVVPRLTSWIMSCRWQELTRRRRALMNPTSTTRNGANDFVEVKTIWWYRVQGGGHERMKHEGIAAGETQAGLVNSLIDLSWTYRRHWNGLVALTPKMDGTMDQC